jgi:hypothetical protein
MTLRSTRKRALPFDQRVALAIADNSAEPVWSRPHDVNQTILTSYIGFSRPGAGPLPCS